MKAIVQHAYGAPDDVLRLADVETPVIADDEVLVRVHAASVHPDVWHVVHGVPYVLRLMGNGVRRPKARVPGTDMAGRVEAVGAVVTRFGPGDDVFGETRGVHQWKNGGAFAELVAVRESSLARKPASVTFEQAASVPTAGFIALQALRHEGRLESGQKLLVNGAAGGVGLLAVQIARAYGAVVTGVDGPDKLDLLRGAGAHHVIDYTREDFTKGSERYDLIVDIPGNHVFASVRRALEPDGTYVLIGHDNYGASSGRVFGGVPRALGLMARSLVSSNLPRSYTMPKRADAMATLAELIEAGAITPVVDTTYPLAEAAAAIRHLESGRARGKIVLTMGPADSAAAPA